MAGDPHVSLFLPSFWYPLDASSPDYSFSSGSNPGFPGIFIGHNSHISWSVTDVQNQATFYYVEKTDKAHPHQYYWNGAWHQMQHLSYEIPVKGAAPVRQDIYLTAHGPIIPEEKELPGETISVDWIGALPTNEAGALIGVWQATNFTQFRDALRQWKVHSLNFVYADDQGNIGMISAGYYPIVKAGAPWLPLPGTGEADIVGSIPFEAVPQVYDPPDHMVFSANQRPVGNTYPYYLGTTWDHFANGYRANEIYAELKSTQQLTVQDMERMQNSTHDYLAGLIVPELLETCERPRSVAKSSKRRRSYTAGMSRWMPARPRPRSGGPSGRATWQIPSSRGGTPITFRSPLILTSWLAPASSHWTGSWTKMSRPGPCMIRTTPRSRCPTARKGTRAW